MSFDYLIRFNLDENRLEGRRFYESSSVEIQAYQTKGGDMYVSRSIIEDPSLVNEFRLTKEGDLRVPSIYEIIEPDDVGGLVLWLRSDYGLTSSLAGETQWIPYVGSGSYTASLAVGSFTTQSFTFDYTYENPVLIDDSQGYKVMLFFTAPAIGDWRVQTLRNTEIEDVPYPCTVMVKFNTGVNDTKPFGEYGAYVFSPKQMTLTGSTLDGMGIANNGGVRYGMFRSIEIGGIPSYHMLEWDYAHAWTVDSGGYFRFIDAIFTSSISQSIGGTSLSLTNLGDPWPIPKTGHFGTGIQEICVWNRVLTNDEIIELNKSYFFPKYKGIYVEQP